MSKRGLLGGGVVTSMGEIWLRGRGLRGGVWV